MNWVTLVTATPWWQHRKRCQILTLPTNSKNVLYFTFSILKSMHTQLQGIWSIIIIITEMIFMVLSSWQSHCESSPGSFDECRLSAEVAAKSQTKPTDSLRVRQKEMAATVHIHHRHFIITQPESWYSFYHPTEGERLSRPRHCSKGVQPVPKAVYRSGCCDKHNCQWWDSNLGPLTLQSGMLPLGHCVTAS